MMTYRELARSTVVLAASLVRSSVPVAGSDVSAAVGDVNAASRRQMPVVGWVLLYILKKDNL